jgi:hypothetical protein
VAAEKKGDKPADRSNARNKHRSGLHPRNYRHHQGDQEDHGKEELQPEDDLVARQLEPVAVIADPACLDEILFLLSASPDSQRQILFDRTLALP